MDDVRVFVTGKGDFRVHDLLIFSRGIKRRLGRKVSIRDLVIGHGNYAFVAQFDNGISEVVHMDSAVAVKIMIKNI
jgi:hypothetical protein